MTSAPSGAQGSGDPVPPGLKRCTSAYHQGDRVLPVSEFYRKTGSPDGLSYTCKTCAKHPVVHPRPPRKGKKAPVAPGHAQRQLEAMHAAPPGAVNVPLLNRASRVRALLAELYALDPDQAATMMPASRCREFSGMSSQVGWLAAFVVACDKRRIAETPGLGHLG